MDKYIAHISRDKTRIQTVKEHLNGTAKLAEKFAAAFNCGAIGKYCGKLHDRGKYSRRFQRRIREGGNRCDHSTAGGQQAFALGKGCIPAAYAIIGHHGGLPDMGSRGDTGDSATFVGRMNRKVEDSDAFFDEMGEPDAPPLPEWTRNEPRKTARIASANLIRMIFSSLVDADYLDTEEFMNGDTGRGGYDAIETLCKRMEQHFADKHFTECKEDASELNKRRTSILNDCIRAGAAGQPGLFTLTVPTGGGKTTASLAFALEHARTHGMKRVIYVIPYTSIIEQNAKVFEKILGSNNVIQHHSALDEAGSGEKRTGAATEQDLIEEAELKKRLATENWDAPVIVTTAVQFFESLFANKPSKCRKLHNIAQSVVIFDEAQMLPVQYLEPCIAEITQLVRHFNTSAVLCTATQPSLDKIIAGYAPELHAKEICPGCDAECFKRVEFRHDGEIPDDELTERLKQHDEVLCIVNTRARAQKFYESLKGAGTYHLSTMLIPKHRRAKLEEIRKRLTDKTACRVISTSLVEAGVDVDFPAVYREEAGLDSIMQAAGRCNREGKNRCSESIVTVFKSDGKVPSMIEKNVAALHVALNINPEIGAAETMKNYFEMLYKSKDTDAHEIMKKTESLSFESIAREFKLIDNDMYTIYVPYDDEGKELTDKLMDGEISRSLFRRLGQYAVGVYPNQFRVLYDSGAIIRPDENERYAVLIKPELYDDNTGLQIKADAGIWQN